MDINQLFDMLDQLPVNKENEGKIEEVRVALEEGDYQTAITKINELYNIDSNEQGKKEQLEEIENQVEYNNGENDENNYGENFETQKEEDNQTSFSFDTDIDEEKKNTRYSISR